MELFKSIRDYGDIEIVELCFAENVDDVFSILGWKKEDKPKLKISRVDMARGCFLSIPLHFKYFGRNV